MVSALIFAGGIGQRMKSLDIPKQFLEIEGKPIIVRTMEHFPTIRWLTILSWFVLKIGWMS